MTTALIRQVIDALAEFSSGSRLYDLSVGDGKSGPRPGSLLVEAFSSSEGVQEVGWRDVIVLSTTDRLMPDDLLGLPATFAICLADGRREGFSGEVTEAAMLGSDGGLARYRIRIQPWLWRLGQVRNCRVWQDKSVVEIVDAMLSDYRPSAQWRWSEDVASFMRDVPPRSYCCQYRESDLDFLLRILAEEGLGWRVEELDDGPGQVLFADSSQRSAMPEDASSASLGGIRFHGARSVEESDSIQALTVQRCLHASLTTVLSNDYKGKRVIGASSPSHYTTGKNVPELEFFDVPGQYAYADRSQAQRYADLHMEGIEARGQGWQGRSTVRTMRAGTKMRVINAPLQSLRALAEFTVLNVLSIGINNMPPPAQHALTELFGPILELLEEAVPAAGFQRLQLAIEQARETGYANCFDAITAALIWRPQSHSIDEGVPRKPVASGAQSAIVVGAEGNDYPNGADEVYCDQLGRIRIRFHWQDSGGATCWVRVAQRSAGAGLGQQFLPRIGQEVLVQFLENDIDRPIVVGAFYNGQGQGGIAATPGGRQVSDSDLSCFETAHNCSPSGQANLSGGHSPVWHGSSIESIGHRNPTAQWGIRSKELAGYGYSELVFDDTDGQSRAKLKSTHAGSELTLGHLIHAADNYRGSSRGLGVELRTDNYGVTRAARGMLVSSYKLNQNSSQRDPVGENASGVNLMNRAVNIAGTYSMAAAVHQSVILSAYVGTTKKDQGATSITAAPLKVTADILDGTSSVKELEVEGGCADIKNPAAGDDAIPNLSEPIIAVSAQNCIGANAGQNLQLISKDAAILMCGLESQLIAGTQMHIQSKQAIGFLCNAGKSGIEKNGLQIISAKHSIEVQAQADEILVNSNSETVFASANSQVELATLKKITLVTAGGAAIILDGGLITVMCPGKITVNSGKKTFQGPEKINYAFPVLPRSELKKKIKYAFSS